MRDDCISKRGNKVFELLQGGAATGRPEGRKLNVFAPLGTAFLRDHIVRERDRAQSLRRAAASIFDAAVSVFQHCRQPPNFAVSCWCTCFSFRNVGDNFAAAENGDEGFGTPINEPAGKNEVSILTFIGVRSTFSRAIRLTMPLILLRLRQVTLISRPHGYCSAFSRTVTFAPFLPSLFDGLGLNGKIRRSPTTT